MLFFIIPLKTTLKQILNKKNKILIVTEKTRTE